jgi:glycosyltransferase involved in cell wall biosynthesis
MAKTLAVINPSKFEGWSSSVEEAKSFGKKIILSSIPVHLEQAPSNAFYFDFNDSVSLKKILQDVWNTKADTDTDATEAEIFKRTIDFGEKYIKLINSLMKKESV